MGKLYHGVVDTCAKIRNFKQITTDGFGVYEDERLLIPVQRYEILSKSQQLNGFLVRFHVVDTCAKIRNISMINNKYVDFRSFLILLSLIRA